MKIKQPFNLAIGLFCFACFLLSIILQRDLFVILFCAFVAISNILIGLFGA